MKLFGKKRKDNEQVKSSMSDKMAGKIAGSIHYIQSKFAIMMNRIVSKINTGTLKIYLVAFCLLGGGISLYFIVDALTGKKSASSKIAIDPISVPSHVDQSNDNYANDQPLVDRSTYLKIQEFKRYIDSLSKDKSGRKIYDSIITARPGLLDSAVWLENLFLSQENNK